MTRKVVPFPVKLERPPEFWDAQYSRLSNAEAELRALLPHLSGDPTAVADVRRALELTASTGEYLLKERALAEHNAPAPPDSGQLLLKVSEMAPRLSISESMLDNLIKRGVIPFVRVGSERRVALADVLLWIREHRRYGEAGQEKEPSQPQYKSA